MKQSIVLFALSLSVLFNIFFAAGYIKATSETDLAEPQRALEFVARELDLDDQQAAAFASLRFDVDEDDDAYRTSVALAQQELIAELDRPQPDPARLRHIVASKSELMEQRRLAGSDRLCDFVGMLRPDQKRRMFERMRRGPIGRNHREKLLSRFDTDGDGQLNETERAQAHAASETRRAERHAQMLERFDANGDGELDDAERAAFRTWRMEQGPRRGGRHRERRGEQGD